MKNTKLKNRLRRRRIIKKAFRRKDEDENKKLINHNKRTKQCNMQRMTQSQLVVYFKFHKLIEMEYRIIILIIIQKMQKVFLEMCLVLFTFSMLASANDLPDLSDQVPNAGLLQNPQCPCNYITQLGEDTCKKTYGCKWADAECKFQEEPVVCDSIQEEAECTEKCMWKDDECKNLNCENLAEDQCKSKFCIFKESKCQLKLCTDLTKDDCANYPQCTLLQNTCSPQACITITEESTCLDQQLNKGQCAFEPTQKKCLTCQALSLLAQQSHAIGSHDDSNNDDDDSDHVDDRNTQRQEMAGNVKAKLGSDSTNEEIKALIKNSLEKYKIKVSMKEDVVGLQLSIVTREAGQADPGLTNIKWSLDGVQIQLQPFPSRQTIDKIKKLVSAQFCTKDGAKVAPQSRILAEDDEAKEILEDTSDLELIGSDMNFKDVQNVVKEITATGSNLDTALLNLVKLNNRFIYKFSVTFQDEDQNEYMLIKDVFLPEKDIEETNMDIKIAEGKVVTDAGQDAGADAGAGTNEGADPDAGTDPDAGAGTDPEAGAGEDAGAEAGGGGEGRLLEVQEEEGDVESACIKADTDYKVRIFFKTETVKDKKAMVKVAPYYLFRNDNKCVEGFPYLQNEELDPKVIEANADKGIEAGVEYSFTLNIPNNGELTTPYFLGVRIEGEDGKIYHKLAIFTLFGEIITSEKIKGIYQEIQDLNPEGEEAIKEEDYQEQLIRLLSLKNIRPDTYGAEIKKVCETGLFAQITQSCGPQSNLVVSNLFKHKIMVKLDIDSMQMLREKVMMRHGDDADEKSEKSEDNASEQDEDQPSEKSEEDKPSEKSEEDMDGEDEEIKDNADGANRILTNNNENKSDQGSNKRSGTDSDSSSDSDSNKPSNKTSDKPSDKGPGDKDEKNEGKDKADSKGKGSKMNETQQEIAKLMGCPINGDCNNIGECMVKGNGKGKGSNMAIFCECTDTTFGSECQYDEDNFTLLQNQYNLECQYLEQFKEKLEGSEEKTVGPKYMKYFAVLDKFDVEKGSDFEKCMKEKKESFIKGLAKQKFKDVKEGKELFKQLLKVRKEQIKNAGTKEEKKQLRKEMQEERKKMIKNFLELLKDEESIEISDEDMKGAVRMIVFYVTQLDFEDPEQEQSDDQAQRVSGRIQHS